MRRLRILSWHIHGSYLNTLARTPHEWYLPVRPGRPEGYVGRGTTFNMPEHAREVPHDHVKDLDLDLIIYQTPQNLFEDAEEILSPEQRRLPAIYLEHNTPKPDACRERHPLDDPNILLVHVTAYNRLMWDNHGLETRVIEHSVAIDPTVRYLGTRATGITVANGMQGRPRIAGLDIFLHAQEQVPLTCAGMGTEELMGYGDVPYRHLHRLVAEHRFLFSPMRYTSLPLAVVEAMTIGMPVVALATTALPGVIRHGVNGYISCDVDELIDCMRRLIERPDEAARIGKCARETARERFGLERFIADWNAVFAEATGWRPGGGTLRAPNGATSGFRR